MTLPLQAVAEDGSGDLREHRRVSIAIPGGVRGVGQVAHARQHEPENAGHCGDNTPRVNALRVPQIH